MAQCIGGSGRSVTYSELLYSPLVMLKIGLEYVVCNHGMISCSKDGVPVLAIMGTYRRAHMLISRSPVATKQHSTKMQYITTKFTGPLNQPHSHQTNGAGTPRHGIPAQKIALHIESRPVRSLKQHRRFISNSYSSNPLCSNLLGGRGGKYTTIMITSQQSWAQSRPAQHLQPSGAWVIIAPLHLRASETKKMATMSQYPPPQYSVKVQGKQCKSLTSTHLTLRTSLRT